MENTQSLTLQNEWLRRSYHEQESQNLRFLCQIDDKHVIRGSDKMAPVCHFVAQSLPCNSRPRNAILSIGRRRALLRKKVEKRLFLEFFLALPPLERPHALTKSVWMEGIP